MRLALVLYLLVPVVGIWPVTDIAFDLAALFEGKLYSWGRAAYVAGPVYGALFLGAFGYAAARCWGHRDQWTVHVAGLLIALSPLSACAVIWLVPRAIGLLASAVAGEAGA